MNTCVTTPGRRRHFGVVRDEARRAASAHPCRRNRATSRVVGTSVMPPSNPFGGRLRSSTQPSARTATNAAPRRSFPSRFGALRGNVCGSPRRRAAQSSIHGQSAQAGFTGVQIVAPRSISACAKSPARASGASVCARRWISGLAAGNSSSTANSRVTTRSTLPSTGTALRIEGDRRDRGRGIAPDPRQRRELGFASRGKPPRSATARAQACRLRARA